VCATGWRFDIWDVEAQCQSDRHSKQTHHKSIASALKGAKTWRIIIRSDNHFFHACTCCTQPTVPPTMLSCASNATKPATPNSPKPKPAPSPPHPLATTVDPLPEHEPLPAPLAVGAAATGPHEALHQGVDAEQEEGEPLVDDEGDAADRPSETGMSQSRLCSDDPPLASMVAPLPGAVPVKDATPPQPQLSRAQQQRDLLRVMSCPLPTLSALTPSPCHMRPLTSF